MATFNLSGGDFYIQGSYNPDVNFDRNSYRGCIMYTFGYAAYRFKATFTDFKWVILIERFVNPNWVDFDRWEIALDGVATSPLGYAYYKDSANYPIIITYTYDYTNQQQRFYCNGYLLGTSYHNLPSITATLTLNTGAAASPGAPYDQYYGTVNSITVVNAANNPTPATEPVAEYRDKVFNIGYPPDSQNYSAVDDTLVQLAKWPDPQIDDTTNCWVNCAYDIEYFAGSTGQNPPLAGIITKAVLLQALLSEKWRHIVRVAVLQPFYSDIAQPANTAKALIAYANANPLIRIAFGGALAQIQAISPNTIPNLQTLPLATPPSALDGARNTLGLQTQALQSYLTRPLNCFILDDEQVKHWLTQPAGVNAYVSWINRITGCDNSAVVSVKGLNPAAMEIFIYDVYNLQFINNVDFPFNPYVTINSTGNGSISQYSKLQRLWYHWEGNYRGIRFYLFSKAAEIAAGRQLNKAFVSPGYSIEEENMRPDAYLGILKMYKICGVEELILGYFTPADYGLAAGQIQEPKGYAWQFAMCSYAEGIFTPLQYRNILLFGTLLDGDTKQFPSNALSAPLYTYDVGDKLVLVCARKYNGEYLIGATYQPLNNYKGQASSKTVTATIDGFIVTLDARINGSVYHRSQAGVMTQLDTWHEPYHPDWWGNPIITNNDTTDMAGINDLGNGLGYIYKADLTNPTPNIVDITDNNETGVESMRRQGLPDAPIGANASSTGLIEITAVASIGQITAVTINGVNQLGSPYSVTTSNTTTEASGLAAALQAYTPGSGYKYSAYSIGDTVYLQSPLTAGVLTNDLAISITASSNTITTVTTPFFDGTSSNQLYDENTGYRYYLNADYDANGVSGGLTASPTSLTNAIDITRWMITRGLNSGIVTIRPTLQSDSLLAPDRSSSQMLYELTGQGSASDVLVFIATKGFVEGDIVYLKNASNSTTITVESKPTTTSPSPFKNIYLANDVSFALDDSTKTVVAQYIYDQSRGGGIFVEIIRSVQPTPEDPCEFVELSHAEAQVLIDTNDLTPCNVYDIADDRVILRAARENEFEKQGTYVAEYSASGQVGYADPAASGAFEACEFDFEQQLVTKRTDVRGNVVQDSFYGTSLYMPIWGYAQNQQNSFISTAFNLSGGVNPASLTIAVNTALNSSAINITGDWVIIMNNTFNSIYGSIYIGGYSYLQACVFENTADVTIATGISVAYCSFIDMPIILTVSRSYSNKVYNNKSSDFNVTINPSSAKYIVMGNDSICGIVNISNVTYTIEAILTTVAGSLALSTLLCWHDITIKPDSGKTAVITDYSVASAAFKNIYLNTITGTSLSLNGTKGDWARFSFDTTTDSFYLAEYFKGN